MENKVMEMVSLTKRFGHFVAVDHLSVCFEEGKIYGFIGPNGAGKSTTMSLLVGLMKPTEGKAYIQGYEAGSKEAKRWIGYSPEFPDFYRDMSCEDYLMYMAKLSGLSFQEAKERTETLIQEFDLHEHRYDLVCKFSTGMKKKVGLAQAMIHQPKILLLDEPTANLDPKSRYDILDTLRRLVHLHRMTVLISSHVLAELETIIDHVVMINHGALVLDRPKEEAMKMFNQGVLKIHTSDDQQLYQLLQDHPLVSSLSLDQEIHLQSEHMDDLKDILVSLCYQHHLRLHLFEEEKITLEGLYKQLMEEKEHEGNH